MLRLACIVLFLLVGSFCAKAQNCFANDLVINSQADLNFFAANFSNCSVIEGSLIMDGPSINDLSALINITLIEGDLEIEQTSLLNLNGLDNLTQVKGDLGIDNNDLLNSLSGLGALQSIGSTTFGYDDHRFYLQDNPNLINLVGLNSLTTIVGSLEINYSSLQTLAGLNSLTSISEDLLIVDNEDLISMFGLFNLQSIGNELRVSDNISLQNMYGLSGLQSVRNLEVSQNDVLTNLNALSNVTSSIDYLYIRNNAALTSLNGLQNVPAVNNQFRVSRNDVLSDISAVANVDLYSITVYFLHDNPLLNICDYPSVCVGLNVANFVDVADNGPSCSGQLQLSSVCNTYNICIFTATSGDWNVPSNWSGNTVPDQNCDVFILNDRICNVPTGTNGICNTLCVAAGSELNFSNPAEIQVFGN